MANISQIKLPNNDTVYDIKDANAISKNLGIAAGDIIYFTNTSTPARLPKGTNDQVLTLKNGLPAWANSTGGAQVITLTNLTITTSDWSSDLTYAAYPYKATINASGVDNTFTPEIILSVDDATEGIIAPVALSGNSSVSLYASELPTKSITIATALFIK